MTARRVSIDPIRVVLIENDEQDFKRDFTPNFPLTLPLELTVVPSEPQAMGLAAALWGQEQTLALVVENLDATDSRARESPLQLLRFLQRGQTACAGIAFTQNWLHYLYYGARLRPWRVLHRTEPFELFARTIQGIPFFL